jgi:tripartite-type tricarboxylate transporter receptor subunit TctC
VNRPNTPRLSRRLVAQSLVALAALTVAGAGLPVRAQPASDRPMRLIVGVPPGSATDLIARIFSDHLARQLGQPVIVENRPGGIGSLATGAFLSAPHDGQTWLLAVNGFFSEAPHTLKLNFDPLKDVRPLVEIGGGGLVLVGNATLPPKTLPELVAWVKGNPGKVNYASYSPGSLSHVLGLQLNKVAGLDMLHVGYKGSPPAQQDLIGGQVQFMFDAPPSALPFIKSGKLRAFAVTSPQRMALLPDVPTLAELGYKDLTRTSWVALWTTPDTPEPAQRRMREASLKALEQPALRTRFGEIGVEIQAGTPMAPEQMSRQLAADHAAMGDTLKAINYKPE